MANTEDTKRFEGGLADAARRSASGKPYLGDSQVVGAYVRGFLARVADRAASAAEGKLTREQASAEDRAECGHGAAVFLGTDDAYESQGQWNQSGGGLVQWIYTSLPMYEKPTGAAAQDAIVTEAFALCLLMAYEAISFHASHDYGAEALQDDLTGIAESFTRFLLGVPGPFADEAGVVINRMAS
jgi:hypothetical protein